jgi:hypothetical protein
VSKLPSISSDKLIKQLLKAGFDFDYLKIERLWDNIIGSAQIYLK